MSNTATISLGDARVREGQPFKVRLALGLDAGVKVISIQPTVVVTGDTQQSVPCSIGSVGRDNSWSVAIHKASAAQEFELGARIVLDVEGTPTDLVATAAKLCVANDEVSGALLFNLLSQNSLLAVIL